MEIHLAVLLAILIVFLINKVVRMLTLSNLNDKYVIVTGCDSGFGNLAAKQLVGMGVNVFASCFTEDGKRELEKDTRGSKGKLITFSLDVTKPQSVKDALALVKSELPAGKGLWGLVNNAGIVGTLGPADWLTREHYQQVLDVNVFGMLDMMKEFMPLLKKEQGRIVNTASIFGRISLGGALPYCMSKFCVESLSDSIRRELVPYGVTIHIIEPGFFKTNMTDGQNLVRSFKRAYENSSDETKEEYGDEFVKRSSEKMLENFVSKITSPHTYKVSDAYTHALTSRFPYTRYVVGGDANFFWVPISLLPASLSDPILTRLAGERVLPAVLVKKSKKD